jgi:hypothetical protein
MQFDSQQKTFITPYGIALRKGLFDGVGGIDKFGYLPTATTAYKTIWDGDNIYSYPSSAVNMQVVSDESADNGITIFIQGLDADYNEISETVTLDDTDSAGAVQTTQQFIRVFRAYNSSSTDLTGDVTISNGGTTYAKIFATSQQTQMAVYTIPAGKRGYLVSGNISVEKNQPVVAQLMIRQFGGVLRSSGVVSTFGVPFQRKWEFPPILNERTDIEIRAKAGATTSIAAGFEIILEDR